MKGYLIKKAIYLNIVLLLFVNLLGCRENMSKSKHKENIGPKSANNINLALIKKEILDKDPNKDSGALSITALELKTFPNKSNILLALKIQEPNWFESLDLLVVNNKGIQKTITIADGDIISYRIIHIQGFSEPFIEVFDQTHMGNGEYSLLQIKGNSPKLVYSIQAVDRYWEYWMVGDNPKIVTKLRYYTNIKLNDNDEISKIIRNDRLTPSYDDIDGDGYGDITLRGNNDYYRSWSSEDSQYLIEKAELLATEPVTFQIKYDKRQDEFIFWMKKSRFIYYRDSARKMRIDKFPIK